MRELIIAAVAIAIVIALASKAYKASYDCEKRGGVYVWRIYACMDKGFFK